MVDPEDETCNLPATQREASKNRCTKLCLWAMHTATLFCDEELCSPNTVLHRIESNWLSKPIITNDDPPQILLITCSAAPSKPKCDCIGEGCTGAAVALAKGL